VGTMLKTAIVGTFATVLLWTVFVPNAAAECGRMEKSKIVAFLGQEPSWQGVPKPAAESPISDTDPIVGFWKVKLMSKDNSGIPDGTVLDAGYSQWHSDGTEIMNSSRAPDTQSFCLGVWKKTGHARYKLNHFAISWANGNLLGPANIREDVTLSHDGNSFTGTFTVDQYDQFGNSLVHLVGQIEGKRITVDTSVTDVL